MTVMPTPRAAERVQHFTASTPDTWPAAASIRLLRVTGEADPNILARIVQPMVKLDLMPRYFQVLREDSGNMLAEIAFASTDERQVIRLQNALRSVIGITSVEMR